MGNRPRAYSNREFVKILVKNGYHFLRNGKGDHLVYTNGKNTIVFNTKINKMIALRLIKEYDLKV